MFYIEDQLLGPGGDGIDELFGALAARVVLPVIERVTGGQPGRQTQDQVAGEAVQKRFIGSAESGESVVGAAGLFSELESGFFELLA